MYNVSNKSSKYAIVYAIKVQYSVLFRNQANIFSPNQFSRQSTSDQPLCLGRAHIHVLHILHLFLCFSLSLILSLSVYIYIYIYIYMNLSFAPALCALFCTGSFSKSDYKNKEHSTATVGSHACICLVLSHCNSLVPLPCMFLCTSEFASPVGNWNCSIASLMRPRLTTCEDD